MFGGIFSIARYVKLEIYRVSFRGKLSPSLSVEGVWLFTQLTSQLMIRYFMGVVFILLHAIL